jgi:CheY-like chemotaxis protein
MEATRPLILVVDDDVSVCWGLQHILESMRFAVVCAANAAEAMRCLDAALPDLVILDEGLPGCTGLQVFSDIRAHKHFDRVPVLIYSGYDGPERDRALAAGVDAYVVKGPEFEELFKTILKLIGPKALSADPAQ